MKKMLMCLAACLLFASFVSPMHAADKGKGVAVVCSATTGTQGEVLVLTGVQEITSLNIDKVVSADVSVTVQIFDSATLAGATTAIWSHVMPSTIFTTTQNPVPVPFDLQVCKGLVIGVLASTTTNGVTLTADVTYKALPNVRCP